jgi:hypothetical protein
MRKIVNTVWVAVAVKEASQVFLEVFDTEKEAKEWVYNRDKDDYTEIFERDYTEECIR